MAYKLDYSKMYEPKKGAYRTAESYSHYFDPLTTIKGVNGGNSRRAGDADIAVQQKAIDALINASVRHKLTQRDAAYVLATAAHESGFNPDAAAGPTSAAGLGQFVNKTGKAYGLNSQNRWDIDAQAEALVQLFIYNKKIAKKRGKDEAYIYKYHHDGIAGEYEGLDIAYRFVIPKVNLFEPLLSTIPYSKLLPKQEKTASLSTNLLDKNKDPISGLDYEIHASDGQKVTGTTDQNGFAKSIENLIPGTTIKLLVKKYETGGFVEVKNFVISEATNYFATLVSPKRVVDVNVSEHKGAAGEHKPHSERKKEQKKAPSKPVSTSAQSVPKTTTPKTDAKPTQTTKTTSSAPQPSIPPAEIMPVQVPNEPAVDTTDATDVPPSGMDMSAYLEEDIPPSQETNPEQEVSTVNTSQFDAATEAAIADIFPNATPPTKVVTPPPVVPKVQLPAKTPVPPVKAPTPAAKTPSAPPPPSTPSKVVQQETRNKNGHPVVEVKPQTPMVKVTPTMARLEEILLDNAFYHIGSTSGPAAVVRVKNGKKISSTEKEQDKSIGRCYKYVKIALQASGIVNFYLEGEPAKTAGPQLKKGGFKNLLDDPVESAKLKSPYDAPVGAVIVYGVTDGTPYGHIEVKLSTNEFASDYISERPRTVTKGQEKLASMVGRKRKVIGVWVKNL